MSLGGFVRVVLCLPCVAARYHRVVRSFFSLSRFLLFGRLPMMLRGGVELLGGFFVVLGNFGSGRNHKTNPTNSLKP